MLNHFFGSNTLYCLSWQRVPVSVQKIFRTTINWEREMLLVWSILPVILQMFQEYWCFGYPWWWTRTSPTWGGERREDKRNVPQGLLDMDGTSTKYEAHLPTTPLMLTSSTTPKRSALFNPIICREGAHSLLFSKKFWSTAFPECALTVALRVINTTTDLKRILMPTGLRCSWSYLKFIYPTTGPCMMRFSLAIASQYMVAQ